MSNHDNELRAKGMEISSHSFVNYHKILSGHSTYNNVENFPPLLGPGHIYRLSSLPRSRQDFLPERPVFHGLISFSFLHILTKNLAI